MRCQAVRYAPANNFPASAQPLFAGAAGTMAKISLFARAANFMSTTLNLALERRGPVKRGVSMARVSMAAGDAVTSERIVSGPARAAGCRRRPDEAGQAARIGI
jgi:hypothetical protein